MNLKTVVLDYNGLNPGDLDDVYFKELTKATIYTHTDSKEILDRSAQAEVLIVNKTKLTKDILMQLPALKAVIVTATGYDNVDVAYLEAKGIFWSNIEDYSTPSVVQHTFALLLALLNKSSIYSAEVHDGKWSNQPNFAYWNHPIHELKDKTIGLIGYGNIAKQVAKVAVAFGMKVLVYHRSPLDHYSAGVNYINQENLLSSSDIVSLHLPANQHTFDMVDEAFLSKMKESAILINTARGSLIVEQDLADALENGVIAAAAVDVLSKEPPANDNPLVRCKKCLITPHQAWASVESRQRLLDKVVEVYEKLN